MNFELDENYDITYSIAIIHPPRCIDAYRLGALCGSDATDTYDYPERLLLTFRTDCDPSQFEQAVIDTKKKISDVLQRLTDEK